MLGNITTLAWSVGWQEGLIILVVILLLFGGKKLPELAKGLGRGMRLFKRELKGVQNEVRDAIDSEDIDMDNVDVSAPQEPEKVEPTPEDLEGAKKMS